VKESDPFFSPSYYEAKGFFAAQEKIEAAAPSARRLPNASAAQPLPRFGAVDLHPQHFHHTSAPAGGQLLSSCISLKTLENTLFCSGFAGCAPRNANVSCGCFHRETFLIGKLSLIAVQFVPPYRNFS
jgi:hypothetical protein